jgi:hypothetical protein
MVWREVRFSVPGSFFERLGRSTFRSNHQNRKILFDTKPERVPALRSPRLPNAAPLEYFVCAATSLQEVADSKPGRTSAYDDGIKNSAHASPAKSHC